MAGFGRANQVSTLTTSSTLSSSSSFGLSRSSEEVEVGEEVNQSEVAVSTHAPILVAAFILVESSSLEAADNLDFTLVQPAVEELVPSPLALPVLTSEDPSLPSSPSAQAMQREGVRCWDFEEDVADLAAKDEKIAANLLVMQHVQSELKKTKAALADDVKKREANDDLAVKSLIEVADAKENMNAALQELTEFWMAGGELHLEIYQVSWLACLTELRTPAKHLAWNATAPEDGVEGGGLGDSEAANKLGDEVGTSKARGEDHIPPKV
ncbi:hypothetical protein Acr_22g0009790 [Actinidia rufa]|uniref:Uncharacterized protein n=1 Tax=Actinidia rufa TaxID=165716 RepID=A0A7J0GLF8_9ERIC|nr:hypothetical protein Acr_22g0009790 [Actinidia rufa]